MASCLARQNASISSFVNDVLLRLITAHVPPRLHSQHYQYSCLQIPSSHIRRIMVLSSELAHENPPSPHLRHSSPTAHNPKAKQLLMNYLSQRSRGWHPILPSTIPSCLQHKLQPPQQQLNPRQALSSRKLCENPNRSA